MAKPLKRNDENNKVIGAALEVSKAKMIIRLIIDIEE